MHFFLSNLEIFSYAYSNAPMKHISLHGWSEQAKPWLCIFSNLRKTCNIFLTNQFPIRLNYRNIMRPPNFISPILMSKQYFVGKKKMKLKAKRAHWAILLWYVLIHLPALNVRINKWESIHTHRHKKKKCSKYWVNWYGWMNSI